MKGMIVITTSQFFDEERTIGDNLKLHAIYQRELERLVRAAYPDAMIVIEVDHNVQTKCSGTRDDHQEIESHVWEMNEEALAIAHRTKLRNGAEILAELRNALTPIMLLPDRCKRCDFFNDEPESEEANVDAIESRPRIRALLEELSVLFD